MYILKLFYLKMDQETNFTLSVISSEFSTYLAVEIHSNLDEKHELVIDTSLFIFEYKYESKFFRSLESAFGEDVIAE